MLTYLELYWNINKEFQIIYFKLNFILKIVLYFIKSILINILNKIELTLYKHLFIIISNINFDN